MKLLGYTIFLFTFFLPIDTNVSNIFLFVSLFLSGHYAFKNRNINWKESYVLKLLYSTVPFFLILFFGLFFTNQLQNSPRFFERSVSFFLIPAIWGFLEEDTLIKIKRHLFKGLLFGGLVSVLILLALNFYRYFLEKNGFEIDNDLLGYYYTNLNFTKPFDIHPTYLGSYYLISILYLRETVKQLKMRILTIVLFCIALLFLNSRIIIIGFVLIIIREFVLEFRYLVLGKKFKRLFIYSLIAISAIIIGISLISKTYIGTRLKNIYAFEMSTNKEENFNSFNKGNSRSVRWLSAIKLIMKSPISGYGVADEYKELKNQFIEDGLYKAAESRYNAHNQYLGYLIRFGVLGGITILVFFVLNIKLSLNVKDYLFFIFIIIIACINFVENFFDRNAGITFCASFFTVLSYISISKKLKN